MEWIDVYWYEWYYQVSKCWVIKNNNTWKIKTQTMDSWCNYYQVSLRKNNIWKTKSVHRIVKESFHWPSNLWVDHINNDKLDNRLENLDYVTPKENTNRAMKSWLMKNLLQKWNTIATKPVLQYSKDMIFIKEWSSAAEAMRELWLSTIYWALSWGKGTAYWFIWKYKNND